VKILTMSADGVCDCLNHRPNSPKFVAFVVNMQTLARLRQRSIATQISSVTHDTSTASLNSIFNTQTHRDASFARLYFHTCHKPSTSRCHTIQALPLPLFPRPEQRPASPIAQLFLQVRIVSAFIQRREDFLHCYGASYQHAKS